jgi:DNA repair ATPase RecN
MKKKDWAERWLNEIKRNVRHLRTMIDKTRRDRGDVSLIETREGMTKILTQKYDVNSPESVFHWLEDLAKHLIKTKILLKKAKEGLDENSRTAVAYRCTKNLLKKINGRLQNFHSDPKPKTNNQENMPMT